MEFFGGFGEFFEGIEIIKFFLFIISDSVRGLFICFLRDDKI